MRCFLLLLLCCCVRNVSSSNREWKSIHHRIREWNHGGSINDGGSQRPPPIMDADSSSYRINRGNEYATKAFSPGAPRHPDASSYMPTKAVSTASKAFVKEEKSTRKSSRRKNGVITVAAILAMISSIMVMLVDSALLIDVVAVSCIVFASTTIILQRKLSILEENRF